MEICMLIQVNIKILVQTAGKDLVCLWLSSIHCFLDEIHERKETLLCRVNFSYLEILDQLNTGLASIHRAGLC